FSYLLVVRLRFLLGRGRKPNFNIIPAPLAGAYRPAPLIGAGGGRVSARFSDGVSPRALRRTQREEQPTRGGGWRGGVESVPPEVRRLCRSWLDSSVDYDPLLATSRRVSARCKAF